MHQLSRLATWITSSKRAFIFTGAGISTESGIPDFRSPGGVWAKYQPVYFDEFMASAAARGEYWRQKSEAHREFAHAQPNQGHHVLANWERRGIVQGIVTQNIDGLHQLAGNQRVLEIHGTAREAACMQCGVRQPIDPLVEQFLETQTPPDCEQCGGPLKHATISFGQSLEENVLQLAAEWMRTADLVLALGSSLVVHPAASLPELAVEHGARLVIINRDPTPLDAMADLVVNAALGRSLVEVEQLVQQQR